MVTTNIQKHSIAAVIAMILIGASQSSNAVLVAPGTGTTYQPALPGAFAGGNFAGNIINNTSFNFAFSDIAGTIEQMVVRRTVADAANPIQLAVGGLDFYFKLTETGGTGGVSQLSFNTYTGFLSGVTGSNTMGPVFVGIDPTAPQNIGVPVFAANPLLGTAPSNDPFGPSVVARTSDGSAVQFSWQKPNVALSLNDQTVKAGTTTDWLIIRTNATVYSDSIVGVSDGFTNNFTVVSPVPEPSSFIFGLGILSTLGYRIRKPRIFPS